MSCARGSPIVANSVATIARWFFPESVATPIVQQAIAQVPGDGLEESGPIPHGSAHWPAAKKFVAFLSQIAPIVPVLPTPKCCALYNLRLDSFHGMEEVIGSNFTSPVVSQPPLKRSRFGCIFVRFFR
jgi:hypothetical protein